MPETAEMTDKEIAADCRGIAWEACSEASWRTLLAWEDEDRTLSAMAVLSAAPLAHWIGNFRTPESMRKCAEAVLVAMGYSGEKARAATKALKGE
jgi:hypothetical protein